MKFLVVISILLVGAFASDVIEKQLDPECPIDELVILPHPSDCTKYLKCVNGFLEERSCYPGQHWNNEDWCHYPESENAKCEDIRVEINSETTTEDQPQPDPECPIGELVFLPHPSDCTKYLTCVNGFLEERDCYPGQHWSVEKNWCDYPENAKCEIVDLDPDCPEIDIIDKPVHFPHPKDCGKFLKCLNGVKHELSCPAGQYWSVDRDYCDFAENVDCDIEPTENPDETTTYGSTIQPGTEEPPTECPAVDDIHNPIHFPHPSDCSKFLKCLSGNTHEISCPDGQYWSVEHNYCDFAENVDCENEIGSGTEGPEQICSDDSVQIAHPTDCTKYLQCSGGLPVEMTCPAGQHWNDDKKWCDYIDVANCDL